MNILSKFLMAGIITITLPFGGGVAATQPAQPQNPTAVNSVVGANSSYNWSGYQATGGTFTAVSGTWTIPAVPSANTTEADATWVGIGGVTSHDLIQAGTQAVVDNNSDGSGAPTYQAWYEMLPQATTQVPLTVSPGDSISVSLAQTAATSGGMPAEWSVSIRDNTTRQSYQNSFAYNSSLSSAEWIEEMPSDGQSFVPLDNFGTVAFTGDTTTENGATQTMAGANAQELTMVNRADQALTSPSAIGADGESFTVTRSSVSPTTGSGGLGRGWRRTGVGIQGFAPRPMLSSTGTGTATGFGGGYGQQWLRILQQFQLLRQQIRIRGSYSRNGFRIGR